MAITQCATLHSRPAKSIQVKSPLPPGLQSLNLSQGRDGLIYIPAQVDATKESPFMMMLHGAGGKAIHSFDYVAFKEFADRTGTILFAPDSRNRTWDVILGNYGPDIDFIDQSLERIFAQYMIDPKHLAIAGFSDGASYALSVGMANGNLFSHILAFSPGFMAPPQRQDSPPIFISHGVQDHILHIDHCSRRIVPRLQQMNFSVQYREFEGEHTIPDFIADEAWHWFLEGSEKEKQRTQKAATPAQAPRAEGP